MSNQAKVGPSMAFTAKRLVLIDVHKSMKYQSNGCLKLDGLKVYLGLKSSNPQCLSRKSNVNDKLIQFIFYI